MTFEYHWHRGEANFGPVIETEVKKGTHFTIESVLMFEGKFVALRRPNAIPHHEIPERVGKDFLYFVHDLPIWGESLEAYLKRIVLEQAGVEINNFRVDLKFLPKPGIYGNEVSEVVTFDIDDIPKDFGWYDENEIKELLKSASR